MKSPLLTRGIYIPLLIVSMLFSRPVFCSFPGSGVVCFTTGAGVVSVALYYYLLKPIFDTTQKVEEATGVVGKLRGEVDGIQKTQKEHTETLKGIQATQAEHTKSLNTVKNHCEGIRSDLKTLKELTESGMAALKNGQEDLKKGQRDIKTAINESAQQQGEKIDAVKQDTSDIKKTLNAQNSQGQVNGVPAQKSAGPDQYQSLFQAQTTTSA